MENVIKPPEKIIRKKEKHNFDGWSCEWIKKQGLYGMFVAAQVQLEIGMHRKIVQKIFPMFMEAKS